MTKGMLALCAIAAALFAPPCLAQDKTFKAVWWVYINGKPLQGTMGLQRHENCQALIDKIKDHHPPGTQILCVPTYVSQSPFVLQKRD